MKYEVYRYYSTFVMYEIEANSEDAAYDITKGLEINMIEAHNNLETWSEADEIRILEEDNGEKRDKLRL
jgi:hypothetical protein